MLHELPVELRDSPAELLRFQPGVVTAGGLDDPNQSRDGAISGARSDQSNITLEWFGRERLCGRICFHCGRKRADGLGPGISRRIANQLSSEGRGSGAQINM